MWREGKPGLKNERWPHRIRVGSGVTKHGWMTLFVGKEIHIGVTWMDRQSRSMDKNKRNGCYYCMWLLQANSGLQQGQSTDWYFVQQYRLIWLERGERSTKNTNNRDTGVQAQKQQQYEVVHAQFQLQPTKADHNSGITLRSSNAIPPQTTKARITVEWFS